MSNRVFFILLKTDTPLGESEVGWSRGTGRGEMA